MVKAEQLGQMRLLATSLLCPMQPILAMSAAYQARSPWALTAAVVLRAIIEQYKTQQFGLLKPRT